MEEGSCSSSMSLISLYCSDTKVSCANKGEHLCFEWRTAAWQGVEVKMNALWCRDRR